MTALAQIANRILVVRGVRVMLDSDLAALYGVTVRRLNEQVRRNPGRFPPDFCFSPTNQDLAVLRSHFATSSWGGRRTNPLLFTEHGALMASTVLNSEQAVQVSVFVVRAFVALRETVVRNTELSRRLDELERKLGTQDRTVAHILDTLRRLTEPPDPPRRRRIDFL